MSQGDRFRRWPLVAYFVLAYLISWGGIIAVIGLEGIPSDVAPDEGLFLTVIAVQFSGPFLAGIGLTIIVDGLEGFRDLWRRQRRARVGVKWYLIALGTKPLVLAVLASVLSAISPAFTPGILTTDDKLSLVAFGIVAGIIIPFFEETGWTGFALPRLRLRYSVVVGGILLEVVWGVWGRRAEFRGASYAYGGVWPSRIAR
jgi:membrane protease YdiL (CAAX protease family)